MYSKSQNYFGVNATLHPLITFPSPHIYKHYCTFCFSGFHYFTLNIEVYTYSVCLSGLTDFPNIMFSNPTHAVTYDGNSFQWLKNIPL